MNCQNIFFNQNVDENMLDNQQNVQKHNNIITLQKKTIQNFEKKINSLRKTTHKTKLQTKKKQFRNATNTTIIIKLFFVLTKNVNVSTFNNTNFKNNFKKNIKNVDSTKITIISRKIKSLKFEKLKLYKSFSKKKHNR